MPVTCPHCGRVNEIHAGPQEDSVPSDGDLSACWICRNISIYTEMDGRLSLRKPSDEELAEFMKDTDIRMILGMMAESEYPSQAKEMMRTLVHDSEA